MSQEFVVARLDVKAFAKAAGTLAGADSLSNYARLLAEVGGQGSERQVVWEVTGELRQDASGHEQIWLHLHARVSLPLVCQRCMGPADIQVVVDRSFRFVASEAQAETEDEEAEEDVLTLSRELNLQELIEDELLMELPVVPRHEVCPVELKLAAQDPDFEVATAEKTHPFAVLAGLRGGKAD